MGKASSAKKIKKVQQAGVSRAPGQRRNLGYPALITGIIVVGLALTFFARQERAASASEAPVVNRDHWHAAFGINICGEWQDVVHDDGPDTAGIHTHADGLIHIHPFVGAAAGERAVFERFTDQVGIELGEDRIVLPGGESYTNGDECEDEDGEKEEGRWALYVWPPQATDATDPEIVTGNDIGAERLRRDGQAFVLAFVPEGEEVGLPPSMPELAAPNDLEAPSEPGSVDFTVPEGEQPVGAEGDGGEAPADDAPADGDAPADDGAPADSGDQPADGGGTEGDAPSTTAAG